MNQKKAKAIRKALKMESHPEADYKVIKTVKKKVGFVDDDAIGGVTYLNVERKSLANAAKYNYRRIKKDKKIANELYKSVKNNKTAEVVTE